MTEVPAGTFKGARSGDLAPGRRAVPWVTVVLLASAMSFADGFWIVSLRGAVGAIERTQEPFLAWIRESTAAVPVFRVAVLAALLLALRWVGPEFARPRSVMCTALLVALAGTAAGIVELAPSAAWDYVLQSRQNDLGHGSVGQALASGQEGLWLQLAALGYGSALILATNIVVVGWLVALMGGRLQPAATRKKDLPLLEHSRLALATALGCTGAIHAAAAPGYLGRWHAAAAFFLVSALAEFSLALMLLRGHRPMDLLAVLAVSVVPLGVSLWFRTLGLPLAPGGAVPGTIGVPDAAAGALELAAALIAGTILLRPARRRRVTGKPIKSRASASPHLRAITVASIIAVGAIGLTGTVPGWFGGAGDSGFTNHNSDLPSRQTLRA